jgi:hypothetical protein
MRGGVQQSQVMAALDRVAFEVDGRSLSTLPAVNRVSAKALTKVSKAASAAAYRDVHALVSDTFQEQRVMDTRAGFDALGLYDQVSLSLTGADGALSTQGAGESIPPPADLYVIMVRVCYASIAFVNLVPLWFRVYSRCVRVHV